MYLSQVVIENFRCFGQGPGSFVLNLQPGLTALVGENDVGKTAIIDALRFVLGTTDQDWYRLEDTDFHGEGTSEEIKVVCTFEALNAQDLRTFVEYLTYGETPSDPPVLFLNWTAKDTGEVRKGRPFRQVSIHSGKGGKGPNLAPEARDLLRATYLRPLRDAEQALSAGRGSRLSQVLLHSKERMKGSGIPYDPKGNVDPTQLNVLGIGDLANSLIEKQKGIIETRDKIDRHLAKLALKGSNLKSSIEVSGKSASDDARLRHLLEKLELILSEEGKNREGKIGLGSNNLLFMACELLLLAEEEEGNKLLLIEEPEAHLHPQRQLQVIKFLQERAEKEGVQIIVSTHSPNLASVIKLSNMVIVREGQAFSLAEQETELEPGDYRFLERFLDVTKANLFFARGVMIVEGDAENILLPTLAAILGRDFTMHGVSIVNVGGIGLRRYARIFQRKRTDAGPLGIPVACVTDMDVMPDCAPVIIGNVEEGSEWPVSSKRRWRAKKDFDDEAALGKHRDAKCANATGQSVKTFVSDEWTLEYDLALGQKNKAGAFSCGLAEDVYVSACLAGKDEAISAKRTTIDDVEKAAREKFSTFKPSLGANGACPPEEVLACSVYSKFAKDGVSKAIAAQYLAKRLQEQSLKGELTATRLRENLPRYLIEAIDYVTEKSGAVPTDLGTPDG